MYISSMPLLAIFMSYVAFIWLAGIFILKIIERRNTRYGETKNRDANYYDN